MSGSERQLNFERWLSDQASRVESNLAHLLPTDDDEPGQLHEAMRWAALGGGKRIRACLLFASARACHPAPDVVLDRALDLAASAVELIHAYSLIHDDLPCMDDDDMRRGRAATHIQFGEAMALLAGDAMQPLAFEWMSEMPIAPALTVQATQLLARAIGSKGMAGGQAIDLLSIGVRLNETDLAAMHSKKTGALLGASVQLGAIVAGADSTHREALRRYADALGLAFQVVDDVLDVTASTEKLGKTAGKDQEQSKATYVTLLGLEKAQALALELEGMAHEAVKSFGDNGRHLADLASYVVHREH
uniref:polyprenyl synthetase family protein n=1 Tax=Orrella sp. TaxID=1921583 RepID=UPI004048BD88